MIREMIPTKDGSLTIFIPGMNVTYHSVYGAIQESQHVFIGGGLQAVKGLQRSESLSIFEMGFGTGLNALLTLIESEKLQQKIHYTAIELYPLSEGEAATLNYCELLNRPDLKWLFDKLHNCEWEKEINITPLFTLDKIRRSFLDYTTGSFQHVIYFDAFAPVSQPELWTREVFEKIYQTVFPGGVLVTYCSKGDVRRALISAGFKVEKIPGPYGKREMIRATKEG